MPLYNWFVARGLVWHKLMMKVINEKHTIWNLYGSVLFKRFTQYILVIVDSKFLISWLFDLREWSFEDSEPFHFHFNQKPPFSYMTHVCRKTDVGGCLDEKELQLSWWVWPICLNIRSGASLGFTLKDMFLGVEFEKHMTKILSHKTVV